MDRWTTAAKALLATTALIVFLTGCATGSEPIARGHHTLPAWLTRDSSD